MNLTAMMLQWPKFNTIRRRNIQFLSIFSHFNFQFSPGNSGLGRAEGRELKAFKVHSLLGTACTIIRQQNIVIVAGAREEVIFPSSHRRQQQELNNRILEEDEVVEYPQAHFNYGGGRQPRSHG